MKRWSLILLPQMALGCNLCQNASDPPNLDLVLDDFDSLTCRELQELALDPPLDLAPLTCPEWWEIGLECDCPEPLEDGLCSLCEDNTEPPLPSLVIGGRSCSSWADEAYFVGETTCQGLQAVFGVYCGCENPVSSFEFCRVCGDDSLLPSANRIAYSDQEDREITCAQVEFNAQGVPCGEMQASHADVCCSTSPPTAVPTDRPTKAPTDAPTVAPVKDVDSASVTPTETPTEIPAVESSLSPTSKPSTKAPEKEPTIAPVDTLSPVLQVDSPTRAPVGDTGVPTPVRQETRAPTTTDPGARSNRPSTVPSSSSSSAEPSANEQQPSSPAPTTERQNPPTEELTTTTPVTDTSEMPSESPEAILPSGESSIAAPLLVPIVSLFYGASLAVLGLF